MTPLVKLRPYQQEAVTRTVIALKEPDCNPLVVAPTGSGKSVIIAALCNTLLVENPKVKILVLAHRKELIEQNAEKISKFLETHHRVTFYSNAVGQRDMSGNVVVAGIATIGRRTSDELAPFTHIIIDEAHLVNNIEDGQYRKLITNLKTKHPVSVIGFSATPFRMKGGYLHMSDDRLFTKISYEIRIDILMEKGYLAPLSSKCSAVKVDLSCMRTRAGEFVQEDYDAKFNDADLIKQTVEDIIHHSGNRNSWLLFCSSVEHAYNVATTLQQYAVSCATITGQTSPMERDRMIKLFKEGRIKALTNCDVLTVGFDAPNVDLIALLRPTRSCGLYIQMVGRGTRCHPGKLDCLVLDYGENIDRFGPVDKIKLKQNRFQKVEVDTIPLKVCPECRECIDIKHKICPKCDYAWPVRQVERTLKHAAFSSNLDILKTSLMRSKFDGKQILQVYDYKFQLHQKPGKPPSARIDYYISATEKVSEWVTPEHWGLPGQKAVEWWAMHANNLPFPKTAQELILNKDALNLAEKIVVALEGPYPKIVKRYFKDATLGRTADTWDQISSSSTT